IAPGSLPATDAGIGDRAEAHPPPPDDVDETVEAVEEEEEEVHFEDVDSAKLLPVDGGESPAEEEAGFSFSLDESPEPAAPVAGPAFEIQAELQAIFQQEARESLVALQGHLQALYEEPANLSLAEPLERLYHTLKGASATVGLADVSELAAQLQTR